KEIPVATAGRCTQGICRGIPDSHIPEAKADAHLLAIGKHLRARRILGRSAADTKRLEPFVRSSGGGRHEDRPILRVELSGNDARMLVLHSDKLSPCIHSPIGRKEDLVRLSGSPARVGPTTRMAQA